MTVGLNTLAKIGGSAKDVVLKLKRIRVY